MSITPGKRIKEFVVLYGFVKKNKEEIQKMHNYGEVVRFVQANLGISVRIDRLKDYCVVANCKLKPMSVICNELQKRVKQLEAQLTVSQANPVDADPFTLDQ